MKGLVANEAGRVARNSAGETSAPVGPVSSPEALRGAAAASRKRRKGGGEALPLLCRKKRGKYATPRVEIKNSS